MRPLPWREKYTPYSVWISEIMLQQTQMERGVRYFNAWMRQFPDIQSVADADETAILAAWEGLGYYSRARNLHAAAKSIVKDHGGVFPQSHDAICKLKGIGEYTAGAIASIAFNLPVPAVDANVLRIFARLSDIDAPVTSARVKQQVTDSVQAILPTVSPRLFNQALMEFGALVCGKVPKCTVCPVTDLCDARQNGTVPIRPVPKIKAAYRQLTRAAGIIMHEGRIYVQKRPPHGLWPGLWEFPGVELENGDSPEKALVKAVAATTSLAIRVDRKIATVQHGYTTNRVTLHGYACSPAEEGVSGAAGADEYRWIQPESLGEFAFAAGDRKLLEKLGWKQTL